MGDTPGTLTGVKGLRSPAFRYRLGTRVASVARTAAITASLLIVASWGGPSDPRSYLFAAGVLVLAWKDLSWLTREPLRFEVTPETLTAVWANGRRMTWPLRELARSKLQGAYLDLFGGWVDVMQGSGGPKAFRVFASLDHFRELIALIALPEEAKETSRPSIWSRNIL